MAASNIPENESNITNERMAADQRWFVASEEAFNKFTELVHTPLASAGKLEALSNRPSPFSAT